MPFSSAIQLILNNNTMANQIAAVRQNGGIMKTNIFTKAVVFILMISMAISLSCGCAENGKENETTSSEETDIYDLVYGSATSPESMMKKWDHVIKRKNVNIASIKIYKSKYQGIGGASFVFNKDFIETDVNENIDSFLNISSKLSGDFERCPADLEEMQIYSTSHLGMEYINVSLYDEDKKFILGYRVFSNGDMEIAENLIGQDGENLAGFTYKLSGNNLFEEIDQYYEGLKTNK